jgi:hypothetical protein
MALQPCPLMLSIQKLSSPVRKWSQPWSLAGERGCMIWSAKATLAHLCYGESAQGVHLDISKQSQLLPSHRKFWTAASLAFVMNAAHCEKEIP